MFIAWYDWDVESAHGPPLAHFPHRSLSQIRHVHVIFDTKWLFEPMAFLFTLLWDPRPQYRPSQRVRFDGLLHPSTNPGSALETLSWEGSNLAPGRVDLTDKDAVSTCHEYA